MVIYGVKRFLNSNYGKSITILTSGSIIAQIITIIIYPILTRIFSTEELGIYALVLTAESLFGGIICGRYEVAIVSEPKDNDIFPIIKLSVIICFFFSLVASSVYGYMYLISDNSHHTYSYVIIFLFFFLLINGFLRILEAYNNRRREYTIMSSVYILRTSVQNFGAVVLGVLNFSVFGLLISHTFGMIVGLNRQAKTLKSNLVKIKNVSTEDLFKTLKKHYKQPIYSVPAVFANRFSYASINLFLESLFGISVLGLYYLSYKALGLPISVMSNNIAKIFYKDSAIEYQNKGNYKRSFRKTSIFLSIVSIPMFLIMYFLIPPLFEIVFGSGWGAAGTYVKILAPMFVCKFIVNSIAIGLQVSKKQHLELLLQILFIISSIMSFLLTKYYNLTVEEYLQIISITFSFIYIIYFFVVMIYANKVSHKV